METAKQFIENKQNEHFKKFNVFADTNSKIAEWMIEFTKLHAVNILKLLSKTENEYQNNIKYTYPLENIK